MGLGLIRKNKGRAVNVLGKQGYKTGMVSVVYTGRQRVRMASAQHQVSNMSCASRTNWHSLFHPLATVLPLLISLEEIGTFSWFWLLSVTLCPESVVARWYIASYYTFSVVTWNWRLNPHGTEKGYSCCRLVTFPQSRGLDGEGWGVEAGPWCSKQRTPKCVLSHHCFALSTKVHPYAPLQLLFSTRDFLAHPSSEDETYLTSVRIWRAHNVGGVTPQRALSKRRNLHGGVCGTNRSAQTPVYLDITFQEVSSVETQSFVLERGLCSPVSTCLQWQF